MNRLQSMVMDPTAIEGHLAANVAAAARGDRQAYARLVDSTRNLVCSISLAIVRDLPASEDVAQEVYLAAWRGLAKIRGPANFLPWLRQMTRNRARDHVRSRARSRRRFDDDEDKLAAAADPKPGSLDELVGAEESRIVAEALEALPEETREVMLLYYREGKSAAQVGRMLGLREAAVKQRLSRARACLRLATAERFGESAQRTAPGPAFAIAVVSGLPASGPGIAAGVGSKAAAAKVGALIGGAAAFLAIGAAGILAGAYLQNRQAMDDEERRGIWRLSAVNVVGLIGWGAVMSWARASHIAWMQVSGYLALLGVLAYTTQIWLPRVISRRLAVELDRDPAAAARHRRHRRARIGGMVVGALCGAAGLIAGLLRK